MNKLYTTGLFQNGLRLFNTSAKVNAKSKLMQTAAGAREFKILSFFV